MSQRAREVGSERSAAKRGRPPKPETPIKVPLPFEELVRDVLKAGPHPKGTKPKRPGGPKGKAAR